jgi:hypothetical protein
MEYLFAKHNASLTGAEPTHVTITHPHHPLNGKKLELLGVFRGPNSRLVVKMPNASTAWVKREWTDYVQVPEENEVIEASHLVQIEGLREMITIIRNVTDPSR